jgi:AcrR family transcriptional regulator
MSASPVTSPLAIRDELVRVGMIGTPGNGDPDLSTRERILTAAIALYADRGFDACTMRDLASAVGVKAPAIYNHFESKEEILAEASREALRRFFTAVVGPLNEDPEAERFERLVKRWVLFQVDEREIARAHDMLLDTGTLRRLLPSDKWEPLAASLRLLFALIDALMAEGNAPPQDTDLLVMSITAVCDRLGVTHHEDRGRTAEELAEQAWLICARIVREA